MHINQAFGTALREIRKVKDKTQEDFDVVSSRTYVSSLERGLKSITLEKLEELAAVLEVHPLILIAKTYAIKEGCNNADELIEKLKR